jgi:hypothetical protein
MITGILVIFDAVEPRGSAQGVAGLVEGLWELSLSIYCIVKGFRASSPLFSDETVTRLPDSPRALRNDA